jgi:soluble lytic murein transglycosylase-like protein
VRWIIGVVALSAAVAQVPDSREPIRAAMEQQKASTGRQRESIRKQAENLGVWIPPETTIQAAIKPEIATCEPLGDTEMASYIQGAARAQSLEPKLIRAVIEQESGFRPCAVSVKGAQGLMQLMPATATGLGVEDPFDPKENIEAGAHYLKQLLDKYEGNLARALGAYNSGPGSVDQAGDVPEIRETQDYVKAILEKIAR